MFVCCLKKKSETKNLEIKQKKVLQEGPRFRMKNNQIKNATDISRVGRGEITNG